MEQSVKDMITGFFHIELANDRSRLRDALDQEPNDVKEGVRTELAAIIRARSMSTEEFWELTDVEVDTPDQLYAILEEGYEYLFRTPPERG